jgi:hypothetical protein
LELVEKNEETVGGLNSDALGQNDDSNMPGILSMFRTGQALTGQQLTFSSFVSAQKEVGRKLVKVIQKNYDPDKVMRILGKQPAKEIFDPEFTKYDCQPVEGLLTETQRQLSYLELKELRREFPDAAQAIPISLLLEQSNIQFKDNVKNSIKQGEQQAAQTQQRMMQDKAVAQKLIVAQTVQAINKSQAELARADEDKADAQVSRVKMMVEMQKLTADKQMELVDRVLEIERVSNETKKNQISQQKIIADLAKAKWVNNKRSKNGRN